MEELLKAIVERQASDAFVTVGAPITLKVDGELMRLGDQPLSEHQVTELISATMSQQINNAFNQGNEANYAIDHPVYGRMRASAFIQRGQSRIGVASNQCRNPRFHSLGGCHPL